MSKTAATSYETVPQGKDPELIANGGLYESKKAYGQVTIRFPLSAHPDPVKNIIALTYGFLPWGIPIGLMVSFFSTWHFIYLYGPLISVVLAIINEGILKPICKDPRPTASANQEKDGSMKPGMPSGHVLNATAIMVWALFEVYMRGPGLDEHNNLTMTWLGVILLVHLPVPWARWYNSDHSAAQCLVSIIIGLVVGYIAFYLRCQYFEGAWKPWSEAIGQHLRDHKPIVSFWRPPWVPEVIGASTAAPSSDGIKLL